jgi:iron complex outermembrane receptor protein
MARRGIYALIACFAGASHGTVTEKGAAPENWDLRIVAQPLDEALQEFARQSGVQIIFFSKVAEGVRSPGANGRYTLDEAMKTLLAGSGLSFRIINSRTVEIFRPARPLAIGCCNE